MKKIYLAGPMRGLPGCNFAAFDRAATAWRAAGWHPISPPDLDRLLGHQPRPDGTFAVPEDQPADGGKAGLTHTAFSLMACVLVADAIGLLPGWERSRGATMELAVAQFAGLEVYDAVTHERIEPPLTPWGQLADVEAWIGPVLEDPREPARPSGTERSWADVWRQSAEACIDRTSNAG